MPHVLGDGAGINTEGFVRELDRHPVEAGRKGNKIVLLRRFPLRPASTAHVEHVLRLLGTKSATGPKARIPLARTLLGKVGNLEVAELPGITLVLIGIGTQPYLATALWLLTLHRREFCAVDIL
jgi:hypothetical protein